jgi:hypothetical protein
LKNNLSLAPVHLRRAAGLHSVYRSRPTPLFFQFAIFKTFCGSHIVKFVVFYGSQARNACHFLTLSGPEDRLIVVTTYEGVFS